MRDLRSLRGFAVGVMTGLLVGSAGMAAASFGYKGWARFTYDFKIGYITGFLDMANLTRNLEPGGWVDSKYPFFPQAKPIEWYGIVDRQYKLPENQNFTIASMLQAAGAELTKKYGKPLDPNERARQRLEDQLKRMREKAIAEGKVPPTALNSETKPGSPIKVPFGAASARKAAEPKPKKWCRCDGTDPKKARAERQAKAAKEDQEAEEAARKATAEREAAKAAAGGAAAPAKPEPAPGAAPAKPADATPKPGDSTAKPQLPAPGAPATH